MSTISKEILRNMISDGKLKTAGDLHSYLKDMFRDARNRIKDRVRIFER